MLLLGVDDRVMGRYHGRRVAAANKRRRCISTPGAPGAVVNRLCSVMRKTSVGKRLICDGPGRASSR